MREREREKEGLGVDRSLVRFTILTEHQTALFALSSDSVVHLLSKCKATNQQNKVNNIITVNEAHCIPSVLVGCHPTISDCQPLVTKVKRQVNMIQIH